MPDPLRAERALPALETLPRPFFPRAESLSAGTFSAVHRHPWGQLSYAIEGVLDIRTPSGNYVALPQCAVWIPAGLEHQVINLGRVEMRSFYCDPALFPWDDGRCRVLRVTLLVRELIKAVSALPPDYPLDGAEARLVRVLADQLAALPEAAFALACRATGACRSSPRRCWMRPASAGRWRSGRRSRVPPNAISPAFSSGRPGCPSACGGSACA